jgi:hypothetical protein
MRNTKILDLASNRGKPNLPIGLANVSQLRDPRPQSRHSLRHPRVDGVDSAARALHGVIRHWIAVRGHNNCWG